MKCTGKGGCECVRSLLLDPSHGHAHVVGLDHDRNAPRFKCAIDGVRDLGCHVFLGLKAASKNINRAGDL